MNPQAAEGLTTARRSSERARKRHYLVVADQTRESGGFSFVNKDDVLVNGRLAGTHQHREPGYAHPLFVGVPPLRGRPKLVIGGSGPTTLDFYGRMPVFISTRAKNLLEEIDADGFEFAECDTVNPEGELVESYWWMDVIRWVQKFDEKRSDFDWYRDSFPMDPEAQSNSSISALYDIRMPRGFPDEHHAFWFAHYRIYFVFDEVVVDAWRDRGLTGALFTPLQQPSELEFEHHGLFANYPYWTERMRQPC